jgi:uncharacterized protein YsxB (DUF464 family)
MITVKIKSSRNGGSFVMTGHSGYSDAGTDIVCSAASIIAYSLAETILRMRKEDKLLTDPTVQFKPGDVKIKFRVKSDNAYESYDALQFANTGMLLLTKAHPANVQII